MIISTLFCVENGHRDFNFKLSSEWKTTPLLSNFTSRIIDMVALIKLGAKSFPVFQVEIGNQLFDLSNQHKDFSKLLSMMSRTSIELAHAMIKEGKRPEDARVFGIWIGGTAFQFCVAHAVVTLLSDGKYDIHANLTFKDDWLHDILAPGPNPHDFPPNLPSESIITGKTSWNSIQISEFTTQRDINLPIVSVDETQIGPTLYTGFLNEQSLEILNNFIRIARNRIDLILNSQASDSEKAREFRSKDAFGALVGARSGSQTPTPQNAKAQQQSAGLGSVSRSSIRNNVRTKKSLPELGILLQLSKFPQVFPQMFHYEIEKLNDGTAVITYEFEELKPIENEYGGISNLIDAVDDHIEILINCMLFGIQTLWGLYFLHEIVGIVHSDISPSNIMYSDHYETWKLNDFDHGRRIQESLVTPRTAGTRNFIAPESEKTGIYTKASDVFSLGAVITECIKPVVLVRIFRLEDVDDGVEPDPELSSFGIKMFKVIRSMFSHDPSQRPSSIEAIEQFVNLLNELMDLFNLECSDEILRQAQMCINSIKMNREATEASQGKAEIVQEVEEKIREVELKKSKYIIEEKDILSPDILPGPQLNK